MDMDTHFGRPYLLRQGETLLLAMPDTSSATEPLPMFSTLLERAEQFGEDFALPDEHLFVNPILATPLPVVEPDPRKVSPAMLWHPLVWLPPEVARPYLLEDPSGAERLESLDEHAIRRALILSATGLYDAESGCWFDVLADVGVNVDDPGFLGRAQAWQAGAPDPVFDSIDLAGKIGDCRWALGLAGDLYEHVLGASWHVTALDLLGIVRYAATMEDPTMAVWVARAGEYFLQDAVTGVGRSVGEVCGGLAVELVDAGAGLFGPDCEALSDLVDILSGVKRDYAIHLAGLLAAQQDGDTTHPSATITG